MDKHFPQSETCSLELAAVIAAQICTTYENETAWRGRCKERMRCQSIALQRFKKIILRGTIQDNY